MWIHLDIPTWWVKMCYSNNFKNKYYLKCLSPMVNWSSWYMRTGEPLGMATPFNLVLLVLLKAIILTWRTFTIDHENTKNSKFFSDSPPHQWPGPWAWRAPCWLSAAGSGCHSPRPSRANIPGENHLHIYLLEFTVGITSLMRGKVDPSAPLRLITTMDP